MQKPLIIAHRGLRNEYPENTLAAIQAALELNTVDAVEFDVEITDRALVLHQETMLPDWGSKKLLPATRNYTGRSWVAEYAAQDILELDAGSWFKPEFSNCRVSTLEQVLQLDWKNKIACIELKDPTFWSQKDLSLPDKIIKLVKSAIENFTGKVDILSFNPELIKLAKKRIKHNNLMTTLALWTEWTDKTQAALVLAQQAQVDAVTLADTMLLCNPDLVQVFKQGGLRVLAYPVSPAYDEPDYQDWTAERQIPKWNRLLELGVDGLAVDHVVSALEWRSNKFRGLSGATFA